jgi:hypothetical protein
MKNHKNHELNLGDTQQILEHAHHIAEESFKKYAPKSDYLIMIFNLEKKIERLEAENLYLAEQLALLRADKV